MSHSFSTVDAQPALIQAKIDLYHELLSDSITLAANISELSGDSVSSSTTGGVVTKTKPNEDIMKAYMNGHRSFGENKIQEMSRKFEELPKDIIWHMVGHVQSNKIKYMAPYVNLIHGVDSFKSIKIINKEGQKNNRILNCLLQLKVSKEESKFGDDFLATLCKEWESESKKASCRNVQMRFGIVLSNNGGALKKMLPMF